jgi:hypothetical protein
MVSSQTIDPDPRGRSPLCPAIAGVLDGRETSQVLYALGHGPGRQFPRNRARRSEP